MLTSSTKPSALWIIFFLFFYSSPSDLRAQDENQHFSLRPYFAIIDTLDKDGKEPILRAKWLDTIIDLRIPVSPKQQKIAIDKFRALYEKNGATMDTLSFKAIQMTGAQNCHSYGLEQYLANQNIKDNLLFTPTTSLFNWEMAKVLEVAFKRIQRYSPKELQKNQALLPHKMLLVFRDKNDAPIHTVFYDHGFHSKNGVFKPYTFETIKPLLKSYFDTVWLDLFELDSSKFANFKRTNNE